MSAPVTIPPATAHEAELVSARREGYIYGAGSRTLELAARIYPWPTFTAFGVVPVEFPAEHEPIDGEWTPLVFRVKEGKAQARRQEVTDATWERAESWVITPARARALVKAMDSTPVSREYECRWVNGAAVAVPVTGDGR